MTRLHPEILARCNLLYDSMMLHYNSTANNPSSVTGFEREIFIRELLSYMMPPNYRIGTGMIIDSYGYTSSQSDIVIEFPYGIRFPIGTGLTSLYLAETVALSIEVKSHFTKQWDEISSKIYNNNDLQRRESSGENGGSYNENSIRDFNNIIPPIFIVAFRGPKNNSNTKTIFGKAKWKLTKGSLHCGKWSLRWLVTIVRNDGSKDSWGKRLCLYGTSPQLDWT